MAKFIEGLADTLKVPPGMRDVQIFDDTLLGFGIRRFATGRASYFVKYNIGPKQRRKTLGTVVRGNLKGMRLAASTILAKARLGIDVVGEAKAAAAKITVTLGEIVPRYLEARAGELRPKSLIETTRYLERAWQPLHGRAIDSIARQDVVTVVDALEHTSGKVSTDRARTALSALFGWAIDRGYLDNNPTLHIRSRAQSGGRQRVLTDAELVEVWRACLVDDYGRIVRLLILCGQRRTEIGDLAWSEIHFDKRQIDLPEHRAKNGRKHVILLGDEALAILSGVDRKDDRDLLFGKGSSGFNNGSWAKAAMDARIAEARARAEPQGKPMPPWTLHDLRRSFVTQVGECGFAPPHVIESIVNHASGHKGGTAGVYNHASYLKERRQALELWGAHISALMAGRESKIVPLARTQ